jgi:hypothetical protein
MQIGGNLDPSTGQQINEKVLDEGRNKKKKKRKRKGREKGEGKIKKKVRKLE